MTGAQTLAIAIICTCLGAASAGYVQDLRFGAKISDMKEANAEAIKKATDAALIKQNSLIAANEALDAKYTKERNESQTTISKLRADVDSGKRRLQLNASCPATNSGQASTSGVANGASARLTDSAQRDYFTLRDRISDATSQINGLQAYIRDVCLK